MLFWRAGVSVLCLACCLGASFSSPEAPRGDFPARFGFLLFSSSFGWRRAADRLTARRAGCAFWGCSVVTSVTAKGPEGAATALTRQGGSCADSSSSSGFCRLIEAKLRSRRKCACEVWKTTLYERSEHTRTSSALKYAAVTTKPSALAFGWQAPPAGKPASLQKSC